MNFQERMLPTSKAYVFGEEDYYVWGGTMFRYRDSYYIIYSRWEKKLGFEAWVTDSHLCLAKSDAMLGQFRFVRELFHYRDEETGEKICMHNPTVISWEGKFYLYHMINHGTGDWWEHRNHQRIGVAYAEDPEGEWIAVKEPVIDVSEEGIDSLMTSNPTATVTEDNKILMVYKAVSKYGELPKGGKVLCGAAVADHPCGPFRKDGRPVMENPQQPWSVEDPFIWREKGTYYSLVKDFHGYFTKTQGKAVALFTSQDGLEWMTAEYPLAFFPELDLGTEVVKVQNLERPQLYIEDGESKVLLCACRESLTCERTYNIRIPLKKWESEV